MYTEQDYQDIQAQLKKRWIAVGAPSLALLAAVIVSFVFRIKWLTVVLSLILGAGFIFLEGMLITPLNAYRKHLDNVLHGKTRTATGTFKEMEQQTVMRDGVSFYPLMISVGDPNEPEDDRLFYWDANLPRPDWKTGETRTLTAHDKALGAWTRA